MTLNRALLDVVFGAKNIQAWADLDNDKDEQSIQARIDYALVWAPAYLTTILNQRAVPDLSGVVLEDLQARLAGIWLYESRGLAGEDATKSPVAHHRKWVNDWIRSYIAGSTNITLPNGPANI
jgi:hypothetical protein